MMATYQDGFEISLLKNKSCYPPVAESVREASKTSSDHPRSHGVWLFPTHMAEAGANWIAWQNTVAEVLDVHRFWPMFAEEVSFLNNRERG